MKHWIGKISLAIVVVGVLALAVSCNPFDPLAAAGLGDLKIYWVSEDAVYRSNLDGSNIEIIDDQHSYQDFSLRLTTDLIPLYLPIITGAATF